MMELLFLTLMLLFVRSGVCFYPARIKVGLVLDDESPIAIDDVSTAIALVNSEISVLANVTLTLDPVTLKPGQFAEKELCDSVSRGVTVAISVTKCGSLPSVKSTYNHFNIPVINIGPEPCVYQEDALFQNMVSHLASVVKLTRDVVKLGQWSMVNIFYDSTFSYSVIDNLQELLYRQSTYTTLINLDQVKDLETTMRNIYNVWQKDYWRYLIAANTTNTLTVLQKARVLGIRDKDKWWVIMNPEVSCKDIQPELDILDNIGIIQTVNQDETWLCRHQTSALNDLIRGIALGYQGFLSSGAWVEPQTVNCKGKWPPGGQLMPYIKKNTEKLKCDNLTQYEFLASVKAGLGMMFTPTATWNSRDGTIVDRQVFPNEKMGFNGKQFIVSTLAYSFFQRKEISANGTVTYTGLTIDILKIIAKNLNFTYKFIEPADKYWGAPDDDGNWNGIIRQLMDKEVDIAAAGHSITAARVSVVDFADAYYFEPSIVMLKLPTGGSRLTVFLQPLHKYVWACILASLPVMGVTLWLFTRYSAFYTQQKEDCYPETVPLFKMWKCLWLIYGNLLSQGQGENPRAMSGRCILIVWWIFVLVVVGIYSGNLIAFLTVTKVSLPVTSLGDLAKQSSLSYGAVKGSALWNLLRESKSGAPMRVWKGMDKNNQPETYAEGKEKVLTGGYALVTERSFYEDEATNNCNLTKVPNEEFFFSSYGFGFPKGSPLKRMFSERIQHMVESGLLNKINKNWIPRQKCAGLTYTVSKPASLQDTQGAFMVLGCGLGLSFLVMAVEVFCYFLNKKARRKKWKVWKSRKQENNNSKVNPLDSLPSITKGD